MRGPTVIVALLIAALSTGGCLDLDGNAGGQGGGNPFPGLPGQGGQGGDDGSLPVDGLPTTSLSATPTEGRSPVHVDFSIDATDPEGDDLSWTLDFGDGTRLSIGTTLPTTVEHTYRLSGTFTATFEVTDQSASTSSTIDVQVLPGTASSTSASSTTQPPSTTATTSASSTTSVASTTTSATNTTTSSTTSTSATSTTTASTTSTSASSTSTSASSTSTSSTSSTTSPPSTTSSSTSSSSSTTSPPPPPPNTPPSGSMQTASNGTIAPVLADFTLDGSDADSDPLTWTLDFGDGSPVLNGTALPDTQTHEYTIPGNYTATFTLNDGQELVAYTSDIVADAPA